MKRRNKLLVTTLILLLTLLLSGCKMSDYKAAKELMSAGEYKEAITILSALGEYKDAPALIAECENEIAYAEASALLDRDDYENALAAFTALGNFRDSADKAAEAKRELDYIAAVGHMDNGSYEEALTLLQTTEGLYDTSERITLCQNEINYAEAAKLFDGGDYPGALKLFSPLGDFRDAKDKAKICENEIAYSDGVKLMNDGDYSAARDKFVSLGDFRDSADKAKTCENEIVYSEGVKLMESGDYSAAHDKFRSLCVVDESAAEEYPDEYNALVEELREAGMEEGTIKAVLYDMFEDMVFDGAEEVLTGYRDSGELAKKCMMEMLYADASAAYDKKDYETAYPLFAELGSFRDSEKKAAECYDLTIGAELRATALGSGDIYDRANAILQLADTDPKTSAKGAYKLIGEFNGADEKWDAFYVLRFDRLLELCDKQGYKDCYDLFAKRALETVKYNADKYYTPGLTAVMNTAGSSKLMLDKLLPVLVSSGCIKKFASTDESIYYSTVQILSEICQYFIDNSDYDTLSSLLTARAAIKGLYNSFADSNYYLTPRYALSDETVYGMTESYEGKVPAFSGTASVNTTAGKYIVITRDMNKNGRTTPSAWQIDYGIMFALEPENIPAKTSDADFIVTVENTWSKGEKLYNGDKSLQSYNATSEVKLYTADGKLIRNLGSAFNSSSFVMAYENATVYYTEPDRAGAAKKLMQGWFGYYN
ncbi:MAG TPA: hypothetical protein GX704_05180 [Clostridiales bacterium]|nr:hypothetical protein [Clostridiales bacterium]